LKFQGKNIYSSRDFLQKISNEIKRGLQRLYLGGGLLLDACKLQVPAYLMDSQRKAPKEAGTIAGIKCSKNYK